MTYTRTGTERVTTHLVLTPFKGRREINIVQDNVVKCIILQIKGADWVLPSTNKVQIPWMAFKVFPGDVLIYPGFVSLYSPLHKLWSSHSRPHIDMGHTTIPHLACLCPSCCAWSMLFLSPSLPVKVVSHLCKNFLNAPGSVRYFFECFIL